MSGIVGSRLNIRGSGVVGGLGTDGQLLTSSGAGQEIAFESAGTSAISALNNATQSELVTVGSTTTELDAEANLTFTGSALTCIGTVTVGVDNTGHDVKYFGATSGKYWLWDESADGVVAVSNLQQTGTITVGVDNTGHDVKLFGATSGSYALWDESADNLNLIASGLGVKTAKDLGVGIHIRTSDSGASVSANADDLIIESAGTDIGMSILSPTNGTGQIVFGDSGDNDIGQIYYSHDDDTLRLYAGANRVFSMSASDVVVNEDSDDVDFRVESNGNANMLFVDGGSNAVGIGTTTMTRTLNVTDTSAGASTGIQLIGANDGTQGIWFGDTDDTNVGEISYDHSLNKMQIRTADAYAIVIDSIGAVTKPLQPAFLVQPASEQSNMAINAGVVIVWGTEIFDQNGDFASNVFTAPVTGRYQFNVVCEVGDMDSAATYTAINLTCSNRNPRFFIDYASMPNDSDFRSCVGSYLIDMDANDTAYVQFYQAAGSVQVDFTTPSLWSGYLVC